MPTPGMKSATALPLSRCLSTCWPSPGKAKLLKIIEGIKNLTAGTTGASYKAKVHMLPDKPSDVGDDGEFHLAVLGPSAASNSGNPSAEARRYLDETTAADDPVCIATRS